MKPFKISLFFLIFTSLSFSNNSINIGGGLNVSSLDGEEESGIKLSPRLGFNAGLGFEIHVNDIFSILPGASLETRGENAEMILREKTIEAKVKFMYLQIPIYVKANISAGAGFFFNIFAGPELGVHLSRTFDIDGDKLDDNLFTDSKTIDFGLSVGLGFEIPAGNVAVFIRPSNYLGFTSSMEDDSSTEEDESEDAKHRNIKLKVGYKIYL